MRGFVTGSTDTSLWTVYNNGVRNYCGNALPDGMPYADQQIIQFEIVLFYVDWFLASDPGMVKNQKLSANILTPTTKATDHDVPVTPDEVCVE